MVWERYNIIYLEHSPESALVTLDTVHDLGDVLEVGSELILWDRDYDSLHTNFSGQDLGQSLLAFRLTIHKFLWLFMEPLELGTPHNTWKTIL